MSGAHFKAVRALPEEAETFASIHAASWKAAYRDIFPPAYLAGFTPQKRAEVFRRHFGQGQEESYLFYTGEKAEGIAILGPSWELDYPEEVGEICAFYFLPEAWGTGAAQKGLDFSLAYFVEKGYAGAVLWVLEENRRARRFYEKGGFSFDGTRREFRLERPYAEMRYFQKIAEKK